MRGWLKETDSIQNNITNGKKKQVSILGKYLFLFFVVFLLLPSSIQAISENEANDPQIITVSPDQNIQSILNQAEDNATILFQPGTYNMSITISKPLTLRGNDPEKTMFLLETKPNNPGITIASSHVLFSNFSVTNKATGLYTTGMRINSPKVHIKNCHFKNTAIGIAAWSDNNTIEDSTFTNCSDEGILLVSTSISTSNNNIIRGCSFFNNTDGIELQRSSNNIISNCTFIKNSHAGIDAIRDNNNNNLIINCTFLDNSVFDIYFSSSKHNRIKHSKLENNGTETIFFTSTSSNNYIIHQSFPLVETESVLSEDTSSFPFSIIEKLTSFLNINPAPLLQIISRMREIILNM
jgi:parallel beta-helix repeat protein